MPSGNSKDVCELTKEVHLMPAHCCHNFRCDTVP